MYENMFAITDLNGNIALSIDELGNLRTKNIGVTNSTAFAITDTNGNISFKIDTNGQVTFKPSDECMSYFNIQQTDNISFYSDVYMIPCYGQSLAINTSAGASTFSYTESLCYNSSMVNTNIQDMCAGIAESFRLMANYNNIELPENFKIITCACGSGGTSVAGLSKGTTKYNELLNTIRTAKTNALSKGFTFNVPAFAWIQGEEDMRSGGNDNAYGYGNFDPFKYKDRLKQLIDDLNKDIKEITGQTNDVYCISYQVASHTCYNRYPRIGIQQSELAEEYSRMILSKVMYDVDYDETDQVHAPSKTYRYMGNCFGISAFNLSVMHKPCYFVHPKYYQINGTEMNIWFEVPVKPLVFDTELVRQLPDNNYGFNVYNVDEQPGNAGTIVESSTRITSVEIIGDDIVRLKFNKTPVSGDTVTYAINGDYWQNINGSKVYTDGEVDDGKNKSGRLYGSRGCLRDSQNIKNYYKGSVYNDLYNWCVIFEIKI